MYRLVLATCLLGSATAAADDFWFDAAVSADGKHALLANSGIHRTGMHFRVFDIAAGKVETEVDLPVLSTLPDVAREADAIKQVEATLARPEAAEELRTIGPILAPFPFGGDTRIAAAPDGKHVALIAGQGLYIAVDGKVGKRVVKEPVASVRYSPDGKTLVFERAVGFRNGALAFELFATSAHGTRAPKRLAGTAAMIYEAAVTDAGTLRTVSKLDGCAIDVALTAPYRVRKLGCLRDPEEVVMCWPSPHGTWILCETRRDASHFRVRSFEAASGKVAVDTVTKPFLGPISDRGLFVVWSETVETFDSAGVHREAVAGGAKGASCMRFRSDAELVVGCDGHPVVLDVTK